jgi:hypothetical protein
MLALTRFTPWTELVGRTLRVRGEIPNTAVVTKTILQR